MEWKYLRKIYGIRAGVEEKLIAVRPDGACQIFLGPNETVSVPFVFQSLLGGSLTSLAEEGDYLHNTSRKIGAMVSAIGGGILARSINVGEGIIIFCSSYMIVIK